MANGKLEFGIWGSFIDIFHDIFNVLIQPANMHNFLGF